MPCFSQQPRGRNEGSGKVGGSQACDTCYAGTLVKGGKKRCWECGEHWVSGYAILRTCVGRDGDDVSEPCPVRSP